MKPTATQKIMDHINQLYLQWLKHGNVHDSISETKLFQEEKEIKDTENIIIGKLGHIIKISLWLQHLENNLGLEVSVISHFMKACQIYVRLLGGGLYFPQ